MKFCPLDLNLKVQKCIKIAIFFLNLFFFGNCKSRSVTRTIIIENVTPLVPVIGKRLINNLMPATEPIQKTPSTET